MTLESLQMLASAANVVDRWKPEFPYPTHEHHPLTKWTAQAQGNFEWVLEHAIALDAERLRRWGKTTRHKTLVACLNANIGQVMRSLPKGFTAHVNCARNRELGIDFTHIEDTHLAYRLYLSARWRLQSRPASCTILGMLNQKESEYATG